METKTPEQTIEKQAVVDSSSTETFSTETPPIETAADSNTRENETEEASAKILDNHETAEARLEAGAVDQPEVDSSEEEAEAELDDPITQLQKQLEESQAETQKNLEGWQRAAADLANFKRRQSEQSTRLRADITSSIITDVLAALDDLDLAFQHLPEGLNEQEANWVEGFRLVQRKLFKVLETNKVQVVETEGQFDPNIHEAVTYEESDDHESNMIIAELRKGYKIGDRVLRPALVRVAQ